MSDAIHTSRIGPDRRSTSRFDLNWQDRNANRSLTQAATRSIMHEVPLQVSALFRWIRNPNTLHARDAGAPFRDLASMRLDLPWPNSWWAVQALGQGGFGAVMRYQQYDSALSDVLDEIVVKTTRATMALAATPARIDLSKEAAVLAQTNKASRDGLLLLRNFKTVFPNPYGPGRPPRVEDSAGNSPDVHAAQADSTDPTNPTRLQYTWRYYFELCEHGDLERLRVKYKAYGRYLPEPFLWHLFYWLAESLDRLADGIDQNGAVNPDGTDLPSWRDMTADRWGDHRIGAYLVHSDIKPQNIFLGDISGPEPSAYYPIPRIGDMGLANVYTGHGRSSRAYNMRKGTHLYQTPEQRYQEINVNSRFYPFRTEGPQANAHEYAHRKGYHQILSSANVVAVGMVMFQMLTLAEGDYLHDRIGGYLSERVSTTNNLTGNQNIIGRGVCVVENADLMTGVDQQPGQGYSAALRSTIMSCLMLNPEDRISEQDLLSRTWALYNSSINQLSNGGDKQMAVEDYASVYFAQNDIHNAPMNPGELRYAFPEWSSNSWWKNTFWRGMMWQPEEWGYQRPHDMPPADQLGFPSRWPDAVRQNMLTNLRANRPDPNAGPNSSSSSSSDAPAAPQQPAGPQAQAAPPQNWPPVPPNWPGPPQLPQDQNAPAHPGAPPQVPWVPGHSGNNANPNGGQQNPAADASQSVVGPDRRVGAQGPRDDASSSPGPVRPPPGPVRHNRRTLIWHDPLGGRGIGGRGPSR